MNGVPLSEKSLNKEDFEEAMLTEIMGQTPTFQKAVYRGELTDADDVLNFIMNRPNVMPRYFEILACRQQSVYRVSAERRTKLHRRILCELESRSPLLRI